MKLHTSIRKMNMEESICSDKKMLTKLSKNGIFSVKNPKRERIAKVDLEKNPFCQARQLADENQLQNYNKNPRLYRAVSSPRMERNLHNYSSLLSEKIRPQILDKQFNPCHFSPRDRVEFKSRVASTKMDRSNSHGMIAKSPIAKIISNQKNTLQQTSTNYRSTVAQKMSFGHRPQSASKQFNPVGDKVISSKIDSRGKEVGMTSFQLKELLKQKPKKSLQQKYLANRKKCINSEISCEKKSEVLTKLENGFDTRPYVDKLERKKVMNELEVFDLSVAEKLEKYRKLAVGDISIT